MSEIEVNPPDYDRLEFDYQRIKDILQGTSTLKEFADAFPTVVAIIGTNDDFQEAIGYTISPGFEKSDENEHHSTDYYLDSSIIMLPTECPTLHSSKWKYNFNSDDLSEKVQRILTICEAVFGRKVPKDLKI